MENYWNLKNNGIGVLTGQHNVPENSEIDHKYIIDNGQIEKSFQNISRSKEK